MAKYETLYIVQPNLAEEQVDEIVRTFEAIIPEHKGTLTKTDKWGKRKLAYRIGKHWEGSYVLYEYEGSGAIQLELERRLRIHDDIIRYITVAVDPRMAAELERKAERDKKNEGRRDEGGDGWGEGRDRYGDRDDYQSRGPRRERSGRGGEERS
ncbi:MAG TPA: 30S ribosomal protein S6 [Patescibacteria group bacterium]|jgi:small subunit ribosomal protein S6|nr:30S ribosomal protein S6 [Patescibacteria group bacterium]